MSIVLGGRAASAVGRSGAVVALTLMFGYSSAGSLYRTARAGESDAVASLLRTRSAVPEVTASFSRLGEGGVKAFDRVDEAVTRAGRMLTYDEFMDLLTELDRPISQREYFALFFIYANSQRASVNSNSVAAVYDGWDSSIASVDMTYAVTFSGGGRDGLTRRSRFVLSGPKMRLESTEQWSGQAKVPHKTVEAYDGVRYERAIGSGEDSIRFWEQGRNVIGRVQPLDTPSRFHDEFSPLVLQGILDPAVRFSLEDEPVGDRVRRTWVFERPDGSDPERLVTLGGTGFKQVVSLTRGLAIDSIALDRYDFSAAAGRLTKDSSFVTQQGDEWFEEDGHWLPRRIVRVLGLPDGETETAVAVIDEIAINRPVNDGLFSDVIPYGALVTEPGVEKAYRLQSAEGIERLLDGGVATRGPSFTRVVIAINVAIVLAIAAAAAVNWRRKSAR